MKKRAIKATAVFLAATLVLTSVVIPGKVNAAKKISLNKKKVKIKAGKKVQLKLKGAKKKVTWKSSNSLVAKVNKKGKVTAKKVGKATITAKCAGKKYKCKITVVKYDPNLVDSSEKPIQPETTQTPESKSSGSSTPFFEKNATTVSSHARPVSCPDSTFAMGNMQVSLGMTATDVQSKLGGAPDRIGVSPLGFTTYIYNPSLDYSNYLEMEIDNGVVVSISTISNYFRYGSLVVSQEDTKDSLIEKGFRGMSHGNYNYDYESGYVYIGENEYVTAYVNQKDDGKVYAIKIMAKKTSISENTALDKLFKAEAGTYNATVDENERKMVFEWACALRVQRGLSPFLYQDSSCAQEHAKDMADHGVVSADPSDGSDWMDRLRKNYPGFSVINVLPAGRNLDGFGVITFFVDDTAADSYTPLTRSAKKSGDPLKDLYMCTGFASNADTKNITYCNLDVFYY